MRAFHCLMLLQAAAAHACQHTLMLICHANTGLMPTVT